MNDKRKNPYQRLLDEIIEFCDKITYRHKVIMFRYEQPLSRGFRLDDLSERIKAADQLGYEVVLEHNASGDIVVFYQKKISVPFHWKR